MPEADHFIRAGRPARRSYGSAPTAQFDFGPYRVTSHVELRAGLPRRGVAGGKSRFEVVDPASGESLVCEFDRVGMPLGAELMHGIAGRLDCESFSVRRTGGPRLWRKDRVVHVSGAVDLSLGYEHRHSVIRAGGEGTRVLWRSTSGGLLSRDASQREAAVICALVVNAVDQSSSMLRFLPFL